MQAKVTKPSNSIALVGVMSQLTPVLDFPIMTDAIKSKINVINQNYKYEDKMNAIIYKYVGN